MDLYRHGEDLPYLEPIFSSDASLGKKVKKPIAKTRKNEEPEPSVYTLDDHLDGKPDKTHSLFENLQERIFALA